MSGTNPNSEFADQDSPVRSTSESVSHRTTATRSRTAPLEDAPADAPTKSSASVPFTLIVFSLSLVLVRWLMPALVEDLHYAIERGKQRARYDVADERLGSNPLAGISHTSKLVAQRIAPSVVHIDTQRDSTSTSSEPQREVRGQGSGVVLTTDGEILTNHHVIRGAQEIYVTLSDDRRARADVVGVDESNDLALLKVSKMDNLVAASWGDSDDIEDGSMVWAAGSPFGLSKSTTFGIVSATERLIEGKRFLQSDVPVQEGNSGGPLVNSLGQVIGINTAIIGPSFRGISFSIPANSAAESLQRMRDSPRIPVGWLGVRLLRPELEQGARIGLVLAGSPAEKAGIAIGDIITHWGHQAIESPSQLSRLVRATEVDQTIRVTVIRASSSSEEGIDIQVASKPLQF